MEIFNEATLLGCTIIALAITDESYSREARDNIGWVFISLCTLNILTTLYRVLNDILKIIKDKIETLMKRIKVRKSPEKYHPNNVTNNNIDNTEIMGKSNWQDDVQYLE